MRNLILFAAVVISLGQSQPAEPGFAPLFNGRDLSGWVPVNVAPETFTVRDGNIVSTGKPTGVMRTERMYENFIVELEWRHMQPKGNAGFFVWSDAVTSKGVPFTRSIEIQVLDGRNSDSHTSHGDIFPIHGAVMTPDRRHSPTSSRCLPSEWRCKDSPEWNHYRITAIDGRVKLAVNGKEVSGGYDISPRRGYICLEAEGSECHFRNIRIRELPPSTTPLMPEQIASGPDGGRSIYTGVDLSGWDADAKHWQVKDWILEHDGAAASPLRSTQDFGRHELMFDYKLDRKLRGIKVGGKPIELATDGRWQRVTVRREGPVVIEPDGPAQIANIYVRPVK